MAANATAPVLASDSLIPDSELPIKLLRYSRNLSQEKVGRDLKLSPSYVSLIERGIFIRPHIERRIRAYLLRRRAVR